jgi:hypothetical protein
MATRTIGPMAATLEARGVPDARLRAELLVATAVGVSLTRAGGTLPSLRDATPADILERVDPVITALCCPQRNR